MPVAAVRTAVLTVVGLGLVLLVASAGFELHAGRDWFLRGIFTAEALLPLIGLGLLFGQMPDRIRIPGIALLIAGGLCGLVFRDAVYGLMAPVPGAAPHLFLTGPIACVLTGVVLVLPARARLYPAILLVPVIGACLAIGAKLGDPTLYAPHYLPAALASQVLAVVALALAAIRFDRPWLVIGGRILASWMIAIGLLYGGAYLAGKDRSLTPPPFPISSEEGEFAGFESLLPLLDTAGGRPGAQP